MPTHEDVARQCLMLIHNPSLNEPDYAAVENAIVRALDAASRRTVDVDASWKNGESAPKDGTTFRAYAPELVHADFNPWGTVEAVFDGDKFIGAVWDGQFDCWNTVEIFPALWRKITGPADIASAATSTSERDKALEKAAKIVESFASDIHMEMTDAAEIATAIRSHISAKED